MSNGLFLLQAGAMSRYHCCRAQAMRICQPFRNDRLYTVLVLVPGHTYAQSRIYANGYHWP